MKEERLRTYDQAAGLRARLREAAGRPPLVAVASGKGGVGKTLLAVNLGLALRDGGKRVLLVDLDPGLADADVLLGVHPPVTLEECLQEGRPLADAVMAGPGGLLLLPGASGVESLAEPEGFIRAGLWRALESLSSLADVVLLDTGAGLSRAVLEPLSRADLVLLVTNPEPAALTDAYALLKVLHLRRPMARAELVVNRAAGREEAYLTAARLRKVAGRFLGRRPELLGWLPESAEVAASARSQRPFFLAGPGSAPAAAMRSLAAQLLGALARPAEASAPRP